MDTLSIHSKLNCLSCLLTNLCLTAPWTFCSVETNHFRPLANSFRFNLLFLAPPGCQVPSWHSSLWQPTTFGPWPTHFISPCFPKTCISWIPLDAQCPSGILHCGKQPLLAPCHLIAVPLAFQKLVFLGPSWVPSALLALFFVVAANHFRPLANSFRFTLLHKKLVFLGSPWVPSAFLALFFVFVADHHFRPLANSSCFPLLSKRLCFLAPPGC